MKFVSTVLLLIGLLVFTACNKGQSTAGGAVVNKAGSETVADAGDVHADGEEHKEGEEHKGPPAPKSVTLASGETVPVVSVVKLDGDPKAYAGQVAVVGLVEEVYPERRTFTLCDNDAEVGCKDGCCPATKFPAAVPSEKFDGDLPAKSEQVIVIGKLTPGTTGYSFEITEVRKGSDVIIKPKAAIKQS